MIFIPRFVFPPLPFQKIGWREKIFFPLKGHVDHLTMTFGMPSVQRPVRGEPIHDSLAPPGILDHHSQNYNPSLGLLSLYPLRPPDSALGHRWPMRGHHNLDVSLGNIRYDYHSPKPWLKGDQGIWLMKLFRWCSTVVDCFGSWRDHWMLVAFPSCGATWWEANQRRREGQRPLLKPMIHPRIGDGSVQYCTQGRSHLDGRSALSIAGKSNRSRFRTWWEMGCNRTVGKWRIACQEQSFSPLHRPIWINYE